MGMKHNKRYATKKAFKALNRALELAEYKQDIEALLNIGITYFELSTKLSQDEAEEFKKKLGFVGEEHE